MGCSCANKSTPNKLTLEVLSKLTNLTKSRSNLTENPTFSRQNSVRTPRCLNIKIVSESCPVILNTLNLSGTSLYMSSFKYTPYYTYLKKTYSNFTSSKRYFLNQIHETCFSNFEIKDGIAIMLISIYGNASVKVKYFENFPFFEIKGELNEETTQILQAWTSFLQEIQKILKNDSKKMRKAMRKIQDFTLDLMNFVDSTLRQKQVKKSIKLCKNAEALGSEVLGEVLSLYEGILLFFKRIQKVNKEIQELGKKAEKLGSFSGERIVHELLMNS